MNRLICPLLIFVFIHIGCAPSVELMRFDSSYRPPKTGEIDVYMSAQSIDRPYKEIGLITVTESEFGNKDQTMLDKLTLNAKKLGTDGIIILGEDRKTGPGYYLPPNPESFLPIGYYVQDNGKVLRASAIVYEGQ